jgi:hypothetical protein
MPCFFFVFLLLSLLLESSRSSGVLRLERSAQANPDHLEPTTTATELADYQI